MTHPLRYEVRGEVLNRPLLSVTNVNVVVIESAIRPGTWGTFILVYTVVSLQTCCRQDSALKLIPDHVV